MIDKAQIETTFIDLLKINSPSKQERGVADYVKSRLAALGLEVEEDDSGAKIGGNAGNIIAFKKGSVPGARSVFFCCHMDTVESTDKLKIVIENGVVRTDGTTILGADDKAGLAAVIEGVSAFLATGKPHGDVQVLFDISEEVGLLGAKSMDRARIKGEFGYVFDSGMPLGGIIVSAPSHENIRVEITGRSAHAGVEPEKGISAIVAMSNAISKMKLGRIDFETTANVGVIEGGKARNIVPDRCAIRAEARSRDNEKLAAQVEHMRQVFETEAEKMGAKAVFDSQREYATFRFTESDEVVKLALEAASRIGMDAVLQDGGGGSDANVFNAAGVPSVVVGVGYEGPHTPSESIRLDDIVQSANLVSSIIQVAGEGKGF